MFISNLNREDFGIPYRERREIYCPKPFQYSTPDCDMTFKTKAIVSPHMFIYSLLLYILLFIYIIIYIIIICLYVLNKGVLHKRLIKRVKNNVYPVVVLLSNSKTQWLLRKSAWKRSILIAYIVKKSVIVNRVDY